MTRSKVIPVAERSISTADRRTITLPESTWRGELERELVASAGFPHDLAGVVAKRVLQGLISRATADEAERELAHSS